MANTGNMSTTYTDTRVPSGTARYYRVSTINSFGTSAASDPPYSSADTGTTALMVPASLSAQNTGLAGVRSITLRWAEVTGNGTVYMLERSEDGSTGWAVVTTTGLVADATTFNNDDATDMTLEFSTRYYYRVSTTAVNPARRSRPSNVDNATTSGPSRPLAPTNLMADVEGPSRIALSWTARPAPDGGAITGYKIEYSNSSEDDVPANTWRTLVADTMSTEPPYIDDGSVAMLEEGDQRWYRVSAINSAGAGEPSNPVRSAVTPEDATEASSAPTGLTATAMGPTQIRLSWTAPTETHGDEITGYEIEYSSLAAGGTWTPWASLLGLLTDTGNDDTTYTDDGTDYPDDGNVSRSDGGKHPVLPGDGDYHRRRQ